MTAEARIAALRAAAALVDGGTTVTVEVVYDGAAWHVTPCGQHLHIDGASAADLGAALGALSARLRSQLSEVRQRGEAHLADVDAAIAGLGGAP